MHRLIGASVLLCRHELAAEYGLAFGVEHDVDAARAAVDGVGIVRLGRAGGETPLSLGGQHGGAQHADQAGVAHAFHLLVIVRRQGERGEVFRIHARTIHGGRAFVKGNAGAVQA